MSYIHDRSAWWVGVLSSKRRQGWCVATNHKKNTIAHLHNKKKTRGRRNGSTVMCNKRSRENHQGALVQQNNIRGKGNGDTQ